MLTFRAQLKPLALIDLRSDTVTRPTPGMLNAMFSAKVGDDVFGEDPTIHELQQKAADLFGMEAALFCPSGTMTNQIAVNVHTRPGDEIIMHEYSHIFNYEGGGAAFNSGCQIRLLPGKRGLLDANTVEKSVNNRFDIHAARTSLVTVENTCNKGGGSCYSMDTLKEIREVTRLNDLAYHLDGARLFNALVISGDSPKDYGSFFDSISICLSKGLGCPVGSLLLGSKAFIQEALRVRKKLGGGMRQAGILAAAGIYALDHHIERLAEDHTKAQVLRSALEQCSWVRDMESVETNIVIFYLHENRDPQLFMEKLESEGIRIIGMGQGKLRMVTHLDVSEEDIEKTAEVLKKL
ncbi:MAG: threonine aldolase [Owenweeksia sp.]|nr:threonine aldolase [Owenweeksia sp.]MBF99088.1 threonine aldolase [Owenweeksia sp.]HBF21586.1 threonine aldolase [Cryomorphaceae bacterium]